MNKFVNTEVSQHVMKLIQMGADVKTVAGKMIYVKFNINDHVKLAYVYHINKNNNYFLERIHPYPVEIDEFKTQTELIDMIKVDVEQFTNAERSRNVNEFVDMNKELHQTIKKLEDLFLYYNVRKEYLEDIHKYINFINAQIEDAVHHCERLYFKKEPKHLPKK
jgi:hypothetical protein